MHKAQSSPSWLRIGEEYNFSPMRPTISTGRGDDGETDLYHGGRTKKSALRIHALGTIDELNAILGVALAEQRLPEELKAALLNVQRALFIAGADIATASALGGMAYRMSPVFIQELEKWGISMEQDLPKLSRFILPGGSKVSALFHQARAVCRRAERWVVALGAEERVNPEVRVYLNRLSDCLFLAARMANRKENCAEVEV